MPFKPDDHLNDVRASLLDAALPHVTFDGWSKKVLTNAADDAGISKDQIALAFPGGVLDLIEYFVTRLDWQMMDALGAADLPSLKIRERIKTAIRIRLEISEPYKEAIRRSVAYEALPTSGPSGAKLVWRTADLIWQAAGDTATDFNYYSKRGILSGVYSATLLFWLGDESDDHEETWAFLDRRIDDVMQFEKAKAQIKKVTDNLPNPFEALARLRYPAARRKRR